MTISNASEQPENRDIRTPDILARIRSMPAQAFPAVGRFINGLYEALHSETTSTQKISNLILNDVSLTSSVLRLVNSSLYSSWRGDTLKISTISRAVLVLGVDPIANLAAALNVIESMRTGLKQKNLKRIIVHCLMTGVHAKELAATQSGLSSEQAFILGVMNSLGHLVLGSCCPGEYEQIEQLAEEKQLSFEEACLRQIKLTPRQIGLAIAKDWHLPETIVDGISGLDPTEPSDNSAGQKTRALVCYADDLATAALISDPQQRQARLASLRERYDGHISLSPKQLDGLLATSYSKVGELTEALAISRQELMEHMPGLAKSTSTEAKPVESREEAFLRYIDEVSNAISNEVPMNEALTMILEAVLRGLSFDHAVLALIVPDRTLLRARLCLGPASPALMKTFQIKLSAPCDALAEVITGPREVIASDPAKAAELAKGSSLPSGPFALFPITIKNVPLGALYVQRMRSSAGFTEFELRNLRLLRNYAVMALRQGR